LVPALLSFGAVCALLAPALADDGQPLPFAAVAALNRLAGGPHPGYRANHAKGILLTGHFTAASGADAVSKAGHFKTKTVVPVLVRFSDPTGVPDLPDGSPNASPHGIAIRFTLPDGSTTDIVAISATSFPVATPEEFVQMLTAVADSKGVTTHPNPIENFLAQHPKAAAWVQTPRPAPTSFATLAYYGINAFKFTNDAGATRYGRYQILPIAGEQALGDAELKAAGSDYLMEEIRLRMRKGLPSGFRLQVQLSDPGDPVNDGSSPWPATRKTSELGVLTLDGVVQDQVGEQKRIMFTPLALTDGIEPSDDPVLLFRPLAYGVSFQQRAQ
jgi:catalase